MAIQVSKSAKVSEEEAEGIAASAFAYLAGEPARLVPFMQASGLDIADIRARAASRDFLSAVLDYMTRDESLLLVFAAESALKPEHVVYAAYLLSGDVAS